MVAVNSPPLALANMIVSYRRSFSAHRLATRGLRSAVLSLSTGGIQRGRRTDGSSRRAASGSTSTPKRARRSTFVDGVREQRPRLVLGNQRRKATLSYVSQQLADDFQCEAASAARAAVHRPALGRHQPGRRDSRRAQDARLPPVGALSVFGRRSSAPASDEDIHWSLSGNPIFDERGRFLGFRGIGTDLTEQRRSRAGNHAARALRFADRPARTAR